MAVVDASVLISALISTDPHHQASKAWFDNVVHGGKHFSAPTIMLGEVAAAFSRGHGQPTLAIQIVQMLTAASYANLVPVSLPLAKRSAEIAAQHKIRGCDAVYVALAEALNEELISLDKQQRERAKAIITAREP